MIYFEIMQDFAAGESVLNFLTVKSFVSSVHCVNQVNSKGKPCGVLITFNDFIQAAEFFYCLFIQTNHLFSSADGEC